MKTFIVVENLKDWPLDPKAAEVILAEKYLTDPKFSQLKTARIFNLCRTYKYQSLGYYVSLLAAARGHKPLPSITTITDFRLTSVVRLAAEELSDLIQKSLAPLQSNEFTISIYFGKNTASRYDRLSSKIFRLFPAPFIRCLFRRDPEDGWRLVYLRPISMSEIPENHLESAMGFAEEFFEKKVMPTATEFAASRCHLAILYDPEEEEGPSDEKAMAKLKRAAEKLNVSVELITREDSGRLAEFDALFIRETTNVNSHTFRFSRRAQAEGLVVIDDPDSILRCSNKVFLAEILNRAKIPTPKTLVVHEGNVEKAAELIGLPCILKQPDSAFSRGVIKVQNSQEFLEKAEELLEKSGLVIAQEFMPSSYDWRVGILDGEPLFVARYHMARNHWQIVKRDSKGESHWGRTEALPLWQAPPNVVKTALQAANLIGNGLYGVDLKEFDGKAYVIEINDNPDILSGYEDAVLKEELYTRLIEVFVNRVEEKRRERSIPS